MRRLVTDTLIIAERNLIRFPRRPELLLGFTVQPIMFVLLFRYVLFIAIFPLTFISSAFVPTASMPSVLRAFANVNPFTIIVDAMRALWIGQPAHNYVWGAVAWALGIMVVFAPLAVARYRRAAGT